MLPTYTKPASYTVPIGQAYCREPWVKAGVVSWDAGGFMFVILLRGNALHNT